MPSRKTLLLLLCVALFGAVFAGGATAVCQADEEIRLRLIDSSINTSWPDSSCRNGQCGPAVPAASTHRTDSPRTRRFRARSFCRRC